MYILPWFQATYQASLRFCPRAKTTMNLHQTAREYSFLMLLVQLEARVIADREQDSC